MDFYTFLPLSTLKYNFVKKSCLARYRLNTSKYYVYIYSFPPHEKHFLDVIVYIWKKIDLDSILGM